ncbi:52 kDa repressor of the inhibitor of the protein kinase isoform X2 [Anabrus simplex]
MAGRGSICTVYGCKNYRQQSAPKSFYRFPKNKEICKQWVIRSRRADLDDIFKREGPERLNKSYVMCSDHFVQKDFRNKNSLSQGLWPGSLPSVLPSTKEINKRSPENRWREEELESESAVCDETKVVLADAESDEEKISIKDEPTWTKESEDSPSGDSENSNQEITTNVKKEPGVSLLEEPTFVSVKQEPEEYLEGEEVPLEKKIKCEVEMTGHQRLREKTLKENLPLCSAQQVNRGSCFHE